MESNLKITFSAVTRIGSACTVNDDRIYANGKFLHPSAADYAQISLEVSDDRCLFALSDGMEDDETGISMINDLKKFHQKALSSSKGIHVKLDEMVQCVEQASNLLYSVSLGNTDFRERKTAFAGILIDDGSIAAVNMGGSRVYKLDGDNFKLMVNDFKRAERLMKMGIINSEQAEILSSRQKNNAEEERATVKKSNVDSIRDGSVYLICSRGLADSVDEDVIYDILASNENPDEAAALLVETAWKNNSEDNITAMVLKIEETGSEEDDESGLAGFNRQRYGGTVQMRYKRPERVSSRNSRMSAPKYQPVDTGKVISMTVLVILIVVVVLGGYKLWAEFRARDAVSASDQQEETTGISNELSTDLPLTDDEYADNGETGEDADGPNEPAEGSTDTGEEDNETVGPEGTTYVVKAGDMLMKISKKFYGDENKYKLIMEANNITDPNKITVGQVLKIPPLE